MKICLREDVLIQLNKSIPDLLQKYHFDKITTFESTGKVDSFYLGYLIMINNRSYHVYLPYMRYSEQSLIGLTPIWTVETIDKKMTSYRAYDTLENCLNELSTFVNKDKIVS